MPRSFLALGAVWLAFGCGGGDSASNLRGQQNQGGNGQLQPGACQPFSQFPCVCEGNIPSQATCSQDGTYALCNCPGGTAGAGGGFPQGGSAGISQGGIGGNPFPFPQGGSAGIPQGGSAGLPEGGSAGIPQGGSAGSLPPETGGTTGGGGEPDPTVDSASKDGSYTTDKYTSGYADSAAFGAATIYYPTSATPPFPGVAVSPGFLEGQMAGWGPFLATHGYIVLTFDTNAPTDSPQTRATALMAAVDVLTSENTRQGGPLMGKVDTSKFAIMGHSMGGGGTLIAANTNSAKLKATVPLCPYQPGGNFSGITVPTLIIAGQSDTIAPIAQNATPHYASIPASTTKAYAEFRGADHFVANDPHAGANGQIAGRLALSWLKVFVDGDMRYKQFLHTESALSKWDTTMQ